MMNTSIKISIVLSLGLILVSQVLYLPIFLSVIFTICTICIWVSLSRGKTLAKFWTFLLVLLALMTIYLSHKSFVGVDAGVAVLSTFLFAKALETKDKRDLIILFNFALFVAASSFLFSQSAVMAVGVIASLLSCLIGLYRIQRSEFEHENVKTFSLKHDVKHVSKFLLYAAPFFVLLFLFFPRLPPLWHIPIPENKGVTGISDSMSPGDIAELSQSSELAFRIIGDVKKLPPRHELYWRALVLDEYDGQRWTSHFVNQQPVLREPLNEISGSQSWDYQYLARDPSVLWIMGLEKTIPLERRYFSRQDGGITPRRLTQRSEPIQLRWIGEYDEKIDNQAFIERANTRYQAHLDPQARHLALKLIEQSEGDQVRYIQQVLNWYKQNKFVYTLTPGRLGQNRIDEFLFQSRQGFCEHYASSFVMLMRYVGIPARVVTGYQGGQLAPDGKSWEVRQLDAHAWAEVLINGQWKRFDPTAIIAPQRIDDGMQNLIEQDVSILGEGRGWKGQNFALMTKLRVWSDYANYQWQSKVVGYNADSQRSWMSKLGLHSVYSSILVLVIAILICVAAYFIWIYLRKYQHVSPVERWIHQLNRRLPHALRKQEHQTVKQWMELLASQVALQDRDIFVQVIRLYEQQFYSKNQLSTQQLQEMKNLLEKCALILKRS